MINKIAPSIADALAGIADGATVLIGGFGTAGIPNELIDGLIEQGARDLTVVNNNAGNADAGVGAFFTPTGYGTELALNADGSPKETRRINGKDYVLEYPIHGDVALIKAEAGDRWGNLTYRMAARNFGPVMATAAKRTIATIHDTVELGQLDPESIVTPGIFVSSIVKIERVATQAGGFKRAA